MCFKRMWKYGRYMHAVCYSVLHLVLSGTQWWRRVMAPRCTTGPASSQHNTCRWCQGGRGDVWQAALSSLLLQMLLPHLSLHSRYTSVLDQAGKRLHAGQLKCVNNPFHFILREIKRTDTFNYLPLNATWIGQDCLNVFKNKSAIVHDSVWASLVSGPRHYYWHYWQPLREALTAPCLMSFG